MKFNIFLQATGASTKSDIIKVGLLLNHIGDEGLEIFENFTYLPQRHNPEDADHPVPAESRDNYATVTRKYDDFFKRRDPQLMLREQF